MTYSCVLNPNTIWWILWHTFHQTVGLEPKEIGSLFWEQLDVRMPYHEAPARSCWASQPPAGVRDSIEATSIRQAWTSSICLAALRRHRRWQPVDNRHAFHTRAKIGRSQILWLGYRSTRDSDEAGLLENASITLTLALPWAGIAYKISRALFPLWRQLDIPICLRASSCRTASITGPPLKTNPNPGSNTASALRVLEAARTPRKSGIPTAFMPGSIPLMARVMRWNPRLGTTSLCHFDLSPPVDARIAYLAWL